MSAMFKYCNKLINLSLDIKKFDTSNVKDFSEMFYSCEQITSLDVSNFKTNKVIKMNAMFQNCGKLTILDLQSFNTSSVTTMSFMFYSCKNLTNIYFSNNFSKSILISPIAL